MINCCIFGKFDTAVIMMEDFITVYEIQPIFNSFLVEKSERNDLTK